MSSHDYRSTEDLMKIAAFGGGFTINGGPRSTEDLMKIAARSATKGASPSPEWVREPRKSLFK